MSSTCHTISSTCEMMLSLQLSRCQNLTDSPKLTISLVRPGGQPSKPTRCSPSSTICNRRQQDWTTLAHVGSRLAFGWLHAWVMGCPVSSHGYRPIASIRVALAQPCVQSLCSNACSSCADRCIILVQPCPQPLRTHTYSSCHSCQTKEDIAVAPFCKERFAHAP